MFLAHVHLIICQRAPSCQKSHHVKLCFMSVLVHVETVHVTTRQARVALVSGGARLYNQAYLHRATKLPSNAFTILDTCQKKKLLII